MLSTPSMAQDTDSLATRADTLPLNWSGQLTLTKRILAINIFAVLLLAGSFFYIDSFRARLIDERLAQAETEADITASVVRLTPDPHRITLLRAITAETDARLRLFDKQNAILFDSWRAAPPRFALTDPTTETWQRLVARGIDDVIDAVVGAEDLPAFKGFAHSTVPGDHLTLAPDRTHFITSSRLISSHSGETLVMDRNARDIRRIVRAERGRLGLIIGFAILLSVLMSLFLARTIARPLRLLAQAARSVRLGRAREVIVPRLPSRSDEIGQLARAFSDMNAALQARIDATGNFAADVSHELKNPLASLASAAQSLSAVKDTALQAQLIAIITDDVQRLDRLITDISDLSRIDGQLARATFERIDIGQLVETLVAARAVRNPETAQRIAFARPKTGSAMVKGDPTRLSRALENLIDNAFSFSPPGGIVRIGASRARSRVILSVEDEGPGVPANARTAIFERFHSDRPSEESFGKHSGLGLSIVKAIVEAHEGDVKVESRGRGVSGARFVVTLQATP
jgi:two-component system, OmpR family, sensor histidine kinase ChvG